MLRVLQTTVVGGGCVVRVIDDDLGAFDVAFPDNPAPTADEIRAAARAQRPAPIVEGAEALPRYVYTDAAGAIVSAGTSQTPPAGAAEAHYLERLPDAGEHWDPDARAYVARPGPQLAVEGIALPLLAQRERLSQLKSIALAAGLTTAALDARLAEINTDLALLAGAYETAG